MAYVLHVASAEQREVKHEEPIRGASASLKTQHGDFNVHKFVSELDEAKKYDANQNQNDMIEDYIDSFRTGWFEDRGFG